MKIYTDEEVESIYVDLGYMTSLDNDGQIVAYSGLYRWHDGTVRDQPDPDFGCLCAEDTTECAVHAEKSLSDNKEEKPRESVAAGAILAPLQLLEDNWDGEGAPKPNDVAFEAAQYIIDWATKYGIPILEADADVMGGIAIYLKNKVDDTTVWAACMNNGDLHCLDQWGVPIASIGIFLTKNLK